MFQHNFWDWIVQGFSDIPAPVLAALPQHSDLGLVNLVMIVFGNSLPVVLFLVGSFFHMGIFGLVVGAILILEAVRAGIAVYRWGVSFIPLP